MLLTCAPQNTHIHMYLYLYPYTYVSIYLYNWGECVSRLDSTAFPHCLLVNTATAIEVYALVCSPPARHTRSPIFCHQPIIPANSSAETKEAAPLPVQRSTGECGPGPHPPDLSLFTACTAPDPSVEAVGNDELPPVATAGPQAASLPDCEHAKPRPGSLASLQLGRVQRVELPNHSHVTGESDCPSLSSSLFCLFFFFDKGVPGNTQAVPFPGVCPFHFSPSPTPHLTLSINQTSLFSTSPSGRPGSCRCSPIAHCEECHVQQRKVFRCYHARSGLPTRPHASADVGSFVHNWRCCCFDDGLADACATAFTW
jgi:hypothetical protein